MFSLFLILFQPIMAWNESIMVLFNFLNFFAIFWNFYYESGWNGTERNDNFYFLSFSDYSSLFWLEMNPSWYFLIFWIFLLFFWNFLLRVGLKRNGTIIFIFSLSWTIPAYFGLKWIHNCIFEFFCYFFDIFYYASGWNRTER